MLLLIRQVDERKFLCTAQQLDPDYQADVVAVVSLSTHDTLACVVVGVAQDFGVHVLRPLLASAYTILKR